VNLRFRGTLPEVSADKLLAVLNDTHSSGLLNHTVEVMVWKRSAVAFGVGVVAGFLLAWLIAR
jgi:hypothetical protein